MVWLLAVVSLFSHRWSGVGTQPRGKGLASAAGHASSLRGLGQGFIFLQKAASHPDKWEDGLARHPGLSALLSV